MADSPKGDILVVDDSPNDLRLLSNMLTEQGYKIRSVKNGTMALKVAQTVLPDLILLDIKMPEIDGYRVCQQLKEQPETQKIPVIFISGLDEVLDKVKAFNVGGVDYVTKPFQLEEVLARTENQFSLLHLHQTLQQKNDLLQQEIRERERRSQALQLISEGTAAKTGGDFFRACTRYLAKVLKVRYALITEFTNTKQNRVRTLAFWTGEAWGDPIAYDLAFTPCESVLEGKPQYYSENVQDLFPNDPDLVELGVQSFLGIPLTGTTGEILGHLAVMDTAAIVHDAEQERILTIFAARAGAELERKQAEDALRQSEVRERDKANQLEQTLDELRRTQTQLIQTEKMSSLGQMVAGIAHEINNPVNFIHGNLAPAKDYFQDLLDLVHLYQVEYPEPTLPIQRHTQAIDLDFVTEDLQKLLASMRSGSDRIHQIVKSLQTFARADGTKISPVDLHEGINNTLLILQHRLKGNRDRPSIEVVKDYGSIPPIPCHASQINQVFMNILANAIDALEEEIAFSGEWKIHASKQDSRSSSGSNVSSHLDEDWMPQISPQIRISTESVNPTAVRIRIADNGPGIPENIRSRLFDPFFTTKSVGKGLGLGLSISYQIVEQHGGTLSCDSSVGRGTEFMIELPLRLVKIGHSRFKRTT